MTDREKVVWIADKVGALKRQTPKYAYISDMRYEFTEEGDIKRVSERVPHRDGQWRDVK